MSEKVEYLEPGSTIMEAAQRMKELGCGFLPVGDKKDQKLQGVITDRDIVVRGVAEGLDPKKTPISKVETEKVNRHQFARHLSAIQNGNQRGIYEQQALPRRIQD